MAKKKSRDLLAGRYADIEDGKIVLYDIDRQDGDGWGVVRVDRLPTTIRAVNSNLDPELFPLKVEHSFDGTVMITPRSGLAPRRVSVGESVLRRDLATREKIVLDEGELSEKESEKRWRHILLKLRDAHRLVDISVHRRLPKKGKEIFATFAEALSDNFDTDVAQDKIYDKYGLELSNDFIGAVRVFSGNSSGSNRVFVLSDKAGNHTPLAVYGEIPAIDWASLPL